MEYYHYPSSVARIMIGSRFSKDNATANRTARAQENNRLGLGRELGRVFSKQHDVRNVKAHVLEVRLFVDSARY